MFKDGVLQLRAAEYGFEVTEKIKRVRKKKGETVRELRKGKVGNDNFDFVFVYGVFDLSGII